MTAIEAVLSMPDGYCEAELQLIWRNSPMPLCEIMSLPTGYKITKGEAMRLWNARPKTEAEQIELEKDIEVFRELERLQDEKSKKPFAGSALRDMANH